MNIEERAAMERRITAMETRISELERHIAEMLLNSRPLSGTTLKLPEKRKSVG